MAGNSNKRSHGKSSSSDVDGTPEKKQAIENSPGAVPMPVKVDAQANTSNSSGAPNPNVGDVHAIDDDNLFDELNSVAERKIVNCEKFELDCAYHLKEIYTISTAVSERSVVGGWQKEGEGEIMYVWMPSSLGSFTEPRVLKLNAAIQSGKKAYARYFGKAPLPNGKWKWDLRWSKT